MSDSSQITWVFLRGLTREAGHWGSFVRDFSSLQPTAKVITLDFPGNGIFHQAASATNVSQMVQHCRMELARMGEQGPVHLLAMSLGAMVAVQWCHEAPQEISACVLINTSMRPFSLPWQRLRPANYAVLLKLLLSGADAEQWEQTILRLTSNDARAHAGIVPYWTQIRSQRPVSIVNAWRQLWSAASYRAPALRPSPPLLMLASRQDQLVSPQCSEAIARRWSCSIEWHQWAGHDLPLDDGPWVIMKVAVWLLTLGSTATPSQAAALQATAAPPHS